MNSPPVLPDLARVVRGLSALFWSIPATLLLDAKMAVDPTWHSYGVIPTAVAGGMLVFGIRQLRFFQAQERIWIAALERVEIFSWLLLSLSPFPLWWNRSPEQPFLSRSVVVLVFAGLAFLLTMNHALFRLSLMIPDETLRLETRIFSRLNRGLLILQTMLLGIYLLLQQQRHELSAIGINLFNLLDASKIWLVLLFALVPVALTLTLIWKAKDVILSSAFQAHVPSAKSTDSSG